MNEMQVNWSENEGPHELLSRLFINEIASKCDTILSTFSSRLNEYTEYTRQFVLIEYERMLLKNRKVPWQIMQKLIKGQLIEQCVSFVERIDDVAEGLTDVFPTFGMQKRHYPNPILSAPEIEVPSGIVYDCEKCNRSFISKAQLQRHFTNKHILQHPCKKCAALFKNPIDAWVHSQIIHEKDSKYYTTFCIKCGKDLHDGRHLRKHLMQIHFRDVSQDFYQSTATQSDQNTAQGFDVHLAELKTGENKVRRKISGKVHVITTSEKIRSKLKKMQVLSGTQPSLSYSKEFASFNKRL